MAGAPDSARWARVVVPGMGLGEGRDHDEERHDPKDRSEPSQQGAGA